MRQRLTDSEKLVLFALSEDPTRTDSEISCRIDMKETTVGQNRRNLLEKKYMEFINVPALNKLGFEFLAGFRRQLNPALHGNIDAPTCSRFLRGHPEIFDGVVHEGFIGFMGAFVDLTGFLRFRDECDEFFHRSCCPRYRLLSSVFPFDISRMKRTIDFAPCLKRIFRLDSFEPQVESPMVAKREEAVDLSRTEARVFAEIIASPTESDAQIARRLRRSRQSITDLRKSFQKMGLYRKAAFPDFRSSAIGTIAYVHMQFRSHVTFEKKVEIAGDNWWKQPFYLMERNSELWASYPFRDMNEYSSLINSYIGPFHDSGITIGEPDINVISVGNATDLLDYYCEPLIERWASQF